MTHEEKLAILTAATNLAYERLAAMKQEDTTSENLTRLLQNISSLGYEFANVKFAEAHPCSCGGTGLCHDAETPTPKTELTPAPDELPTHPATPADETTAPTLTLVEVRAKLADIAAVSGVDLPGLLAQFGASKLSEVDPTKYADLLAAAHKAAEEA